MEGFYNLMYAGVPSTIVCVLRDIVKNSLKSYSDKIYTNGDQFVPFFRNFYKYLYIYGCSHDFGTILII